MKKRLVLILSFALVATLLMAAISYAVSPEEQAKICAQENLPNYIGMIGDAYSDFHFSSKEDLAKAYLGEPIPNVRIGMKELDKKKMLKDQAQPFAFYVFPVMVDGKVVTDFTVVLEDGKWKPVDIGGKLSTIIKDMSSQNEYVPESSVVLRFAAQTFVIVNKDGQEYGYLPYFDDSEMGVKAKKLIPSKDFRDALKKKADIMTDHDKLVPNDTEEMIAGGEHEAPSLSFNQDSVCNRLARYLSYTF